MGGRDWSEVRFGRFTPGKQTYCTGGCVGPRVGLDRCGKISPLTGIWSPNRAAHSDSLYRLRYPAPRRRKLWTAFCAFTRFPTVIDCIAIYAVVFQYIKCSHQNCVCILFYSPANTDNRNNVVTDYATTYLQVNSVNSENTIWEEI
jgi:hypothetical protein